MSSTPQPRILVVDGEPLDPALYESLTGEGCQVVAAKTGEEGFPLALRLRPHLVIVEAALPGMDGVAFVRKLRHNSITATVPILMLSSKTASADRVAGFQAGADDYVTKPFQPREVAYRVKRLLTLPPVPAAGTASRGTGRIIALFSPKGGVGKTTIAVNLALALRLRSKKPVALVDADLFFGNVGVHLNLSQDRTIIDLIPHFFELDTEVMDQVLMQHGSGVCVLLSPSRPEEGERITPEHVKQLLAYMSQVYPYVLFDCQASYEERTLTILEHADDLLLVVTPEIGPFRNTTLFLDMAESIGIPKDRIRIVLNRANSRVGIELRQLEGTFNRPVDYSIMSGGRAVVLSANRGTPMVLDQPNHPFSKQILAIADNLIQNAPKR